MLSFLPPRQALYVSLETAEGYFSNRLHSDLWDSASETDRKKALAWSASVIQNAYIWNDGAYTEEDGWNEAVQYAVCEEAIWLLKVDPTDYPAILTKGLVSGSVGSVSGTFSKEMVAPLVCLAARSLIGELGTLLDDGFGTVRSTMLGG